MKTYTELCQFSTYEEKLEYLMIKGVVGVDTFGADRVFNQMFYRSEEWKRFRRGIIIRDNGCDLGVPGHEFVDREPIIIHHINPISIDDIRNSTWLLMDPENAISCRLFTHNAIHYSAAPPKVEPIIRVANDTCPWKK